MNYTPDNSTGKLLSKNAAVRVVFLYAAFACLWILFSDWILVWLVSNPTQIAFWAIVKGWLFVAVTSLLLFGMIQRQLSQTFSLSARESEAQASLNQQAQRSEALLNLPLAADAMNETDFLQHGLAITEQLTGSQIGFVHLVHDDQETIELLTWSQSTLTGYCTASIGRHYPISQAGIWADALRQRKPVLINDYANASGKHGLPEGHARLERLISVPVIEDGLVRMMMGVGNKPLPYTDMDVETARLVAQTLYRIFSKRRSDEAMHQSQESLKEAQRIASIGSYALDIATGRWESSEELDRLFGISASFDRSVQSWESLIHPEDRAMMSHYFQNQVAGQHRMFDMEYRIVRPNNETERWVHGLGRLQFDAQGDLQKMVGTIQDITERKQSDSQIQALAFSDPLTGLPNRRLLLDRLEQAMAATLRHGYQGALLFIDLDDFKTLNDTLGHDKGDLLLQQITHRLIGCVREGDTVARLGGDEFVVLLENLISTAPEAAAQAQVVAVKILNTLGQPYELEGHGHHSTASIGVTLFGGPQRESIDEPLKRGELAMYEAKAAGRNSIRLFEPMMQTALAGRAGLEVDLREALTKGQFILYYQAQCGDKNQLSGVEALVRWQHPQRGLVSPQEFIPIAEASGLILPLGRWVLETACKQLAAWALRPERSHLTMAVNVSARQIRQSSFVPEVLAILEATGAKPERLKLELTESGLLDNVTDTIAKMNTLKAQGVSFSLDDFGTGYSSLSYLKRLPLAQLKIDMSFIKDILTDLNDAAIANMVVALGESMGLTVIAEGVETESQKDFLAKLGCNNYQGYLFNKPAPIDEFEAFAA
jgi:diguanylate cyclase (GGDEF)-like protein/PAS domain S-box-containing protein